MERALEKDDLACLMAVERCPGIGPQRLQKLLSNLDIPITELIALPRSDLLDLNFNPRQADYLVNPDWPGVEAALNWRDQSDDHHILAVTEARYPQLLQQIIDPPPILYARGRLDLISTPQIAMVGSRHCTPGGAETARDFAAFLSRSGLTITSGLAMGIDHHAHRAALDSNGKTIAVIGTGIDRVYPAANRQLAQAIADNGLIISEFALGTKPSAGNFPRRNRIISGLSVATLVVEATRKSGSLITARCGMEQGREVFAIPGSIHNPHSKGCHQLIRDGAKLVDQASDIIDDIGSLLGFIAEQTDSLADSTDPQPLDADYQQLLDVMGYDPVSIDSLVMRSGLTVEQLSSMLLLLELNDHIRSAPGGKYIRC